MTQDTSTKYIELNAFLKINGIADTGGTAKRIIRAGAVKVNEEIETRNKRKLYADDIVEYLGNKYEVKEKMLR